MPGEVGKDRSGIASVGFLDRLAHRVVQGTALAGAQFVVERDPHQGVGELVKPRADLLDKVCRKRLIEGLQHGFLGVIMTGANQHVGRKIPSDHRGQSQNIVAGSGQQIEPTPDHLPHPFRKPDCPWCDGSGRGVAEMALLLQEPHHFPHEQWIALGLVVDRADQPGGRDDTGSDGNEAAHFLDAQPRQVQTQHLRHPCQARV